MCSLEAGSVAVPGYNDVFARCTLNFPLEA